MGRTYPQIDNGLAAWLAAQPMFFVATAPLAADGLVNCSPKGNRGEFAVLDGHTVAYLDQTGSGVETIAHLKENGRIVLMFCSFDGPPRIVRLHGTGRPVQTDQPDFAEVAAHFPGAWDVGVRCVIVVSVDRVADSCGFGVPLMSFQGYRPTAEQWATRKGVEGIRAYQAANNTRSLDGLDGLTLSAAAAATSEVTSGGPLDA
jgi:hypothetical protein